jgi:polar amino acid transport system permease protein
LDQEILNQLPTSTPEIGHARLVPFSNRLSHLPWWALIAALLGVIFAWGMATDEKYQTVFGAIAKGIALTIVVTLISYSLAVVMGLILALGRVSKNTFVYQISTFYVEIVRGIPTLVLLLYVAFVIAPGTVDVAVSLGRKILEANRQEVLATWHFYVPIFDSNRLRFLAEPLSHMRGRDVDSNARAIIALAIAYSAFIAEIFRSGIESVGVGQMEAARALGMTYWQAMRHIILRQAIRQVLPPLGNDFISMLKDSSLVSILGVDDITHLGNVYAASTFLTFQTYNVMAFLYLVMTLLLSLVVKGIELRMARERRQA